MSKIDDHVEELKKNTEILEDTFAKYNLKLDSYTIALDISGCYPTCFMELSTINGNKIVKKGADKVNIKINFYDENENILYHASEEIYADDFDEFDTIKINIAELQRCLKKAQKVKIFAR